MERFFTRRAGQRATASTACSRETQRDNQAGDGAVATCLEEETRREAKSGPPVLTALSEWIASLEAPPEDLPPAERPGWWLHDMSLFGERSAPLGGAEAVETLEPVKPKRIFFITRTAELGGRLRTAAPLARMGQQDGHGPPDGMAAACVPILAVDADAATVAG